MRPCVSQVCTLNSSFETDIEEYAAAACHASEIWLGKLETYLATHSLEDARELLARHEMSTPVASYQGGLVVEVVEARREHLAHFRRRLEILRALGVETLVIVADFPRGERSFDFELARNSFRTAATQAGDAGIRLALEFQATAGFCNNLETAVAFVAEVGSPHLGICLDSFHFHVGPSKVRDLGWLTPANLFHAQLCDLVGIPRELATDADRVLPGDGDFDLEPILAACRAMDYRGFVSLETMNPDLWRVAPRSFAEIGMTALRRLLGQAEMGAAGAV